MDGERLRVVLIVLDAMPNRHVGPESTPNLWRQAMTGTRAPAGGVSLPVSVTYSNHAAFITGADPVSTGIHGNHTWIDGEGWVRSPDAGPRAVTLFDRVAEAGGRSVMIAGDQHLVGQMGGGQADVVWPPAGELPPGTPLCAHGYVVDDSVVAAAATVDLAADLVVFHLNEADTAAHLHGPDSIQALEQYRSTDEAYGRLIDLLAVGWDRTVVVTLSDHDQESVTDQMPVGLLDAIVPFPHLVAVTEGTAALLHGPLGDRERSAILGVDGVEGLAPLAEEISMVWSTPGRVFVPTRDSLGGQHGGPRCRTQVAVVSGGDPRAVAVGSWLAGRTPSALDWAPLVAELLGLAPLPAAH